MKDLYYILGTKRDCTPGELNSAYRKLSERFYSPGQEHDEFLDDHFEEITEAYQVLSDPVKRRKYDTAYKKNYQRRLYYFKIKHLNVAAVLTLILFTGLFGYYVIRTINGKDKVKKVAIAPPLPAAPIRHHRRKHLIKTIPPVNEKHLTVRADTITPKVAKPAAVVHTERPAMAAITNKVIPEKVVTGPAVSEQPLAAPATFQAYLKANQTGLVYLHEQANYRSAVLSSIPDHSQIRVLEKGNGFYKIAYNGQTGFVPKWTVVEQ